MKPISRSTLAVCRSTPLSLTPNNGKYASPFLNFTQARFFFDSEPSEIEDARKRGDDSEPQEHKEQERVSRAIRVQQGRD